MDKTGHELTEKSQRKKRKQKKNAMDTQASSESATLDELPSLPTTEEIREKTSNNSLLGAEPASPDDGFSIETYSSLKKIHTGEVWRRIRSGSLIARPIKGKLFIFDESTSKPENIRQGAFTNTLQDKLNDLREEERLKKIKDEKSEKILAAKMHDVHHNKDCSVEDTEETEAVETKAETSLEAKTESEKEVSKVPARQLNEPAELPTTTGIDLHHSALPAPIKIGDNAELALLLDHLSLAKEENKEILKMTQQTIKKVTEMSESIVDMKNDIIEAKDTQIDSMKRLLDDQQSELRKLKQENEDLEMLANSVSDLD